MGFEGGLVTGPRTSRGAQGAGVFIEELQAMLRERGMDIAFSEVDTSQHRGADEEGSSDRGE